MRHFLSLSVWMFLIAACTNAGTEETVASADARIEVRGSNAPAVPEDANSSAVVQERSTMVAGQTRNVALTLQETTGSTIVVMDAETGAVLGGRGERTSNWIASTTKLMTLLLAR